MLFYKFLELEKFLNIEAKRKKKAKIILSKVTASTYEELNMRGFMGGRWVPGYLLWPKTVNKIIRIKNYINYVIFLKHTLYKMLLIIME